MKKSILFLLVILRINNLLAQDFITIWDLNNLGSSPTSITFGVGTTGVVNYTWETIPSGTLGSGTFSGTSATISGLPSGGTIRLEIDTANFNSINNTVFSDQPRLIDVEQWGGVKWATMSNTFKYCQNLNITATDVPDLSLVTDMSNMFAGCYNLIGPQNVNNWNTSNVTNMAGVFKDANSFNQPLDNWNVSNVTNMGAIFYNCTSFNQPLDNWNVSNVTNLIYMFQGCTSFNQPIGNWNVSNVTSMGAMFRDATSFNQPLDTWNTSNVASMVRMFQGCKFFNQPLNTWNTSNVIDMHLMFSGATSFNQSLGTWKLISIYSYFGELSHMLDSTSMDCANYATTLQGWASDPSTPSNLILGANGIHYGPNALSDRNYLINGKSWTIDGDTLNNSSCCIISYDTINQTVFNSYVFNGQTLTTSGIYTDTLLNATGCDSIITLNLTVNYNGPTNILHTACNSYVFNGLTLTSSGIYIDTFLNVNGVDSIVNLNLTINYSSSNTINQTACNSYVYNGQTLLLSGTYIDTFVNVAGCDSIVTLNLTINHSSAHSSVETACSSYFFNGQTLTTSGTYTANFVNAAGCDSLETIYLTINQSSSSAIIQSVCNSYVFNGQTLTSSGTYTDTLANAVDCDSIVTLILTVKHNSSTTLNQTACNSYVFNGQTLTASGTYTDTLLNAAGCDSLITLNLSISQVNTSTSQSGFVISSNANGAIYQWVKCPTYSIIPNATSQTYTAAANGSFAAIVTQNGCTDTSNCVTVTGVGFNEQTIDQTMHVYPNPTNGIFTIQTQDSFNGPSFIRVFNVTGQVIYASNFNRPTTQYTINISNQPSGIYLLELKQDEEITRVKVVKD